MERHTHGKTHGEWSAAWSKWAYEAPTSKNPFLDVTGVNCAVGQSGHVWFLAGTFFVGPATSPVVRTCTIPAGERLFFSVGSSFCAGDNLPNGFAGERACAIDFAKGLTEFRAVIDGVPVRGPRGRCRAQPLSGVVAGIQPCASRGQYLRC
jgi:hypothetical protein